MHPLIYYLLLTIQGVCLLFKIFWQETPLCLLKISLRWISLTIILVLPLLPLVQLVTDLIYGRSNLFLNPVSFSFENSGKVYLYVDRNTPNGGEELSGMMKVGTNGNGIETFLDIPQTVLSEDIKKQITKKPIVKFFTVTMLIWLFLLSPMRMIRVL